MTPLPRAADSVPIREISTCGIARPLDPATVIGRPNVTAHYSEAIALSRLSIQAVTWEDATLKGLWMLQKALAIG